MNSIEEGKKQGSSKKGLSREKILVLKKRKTGGPGSPSLPMEAGGGEEARYINEGQPVHLPSNCRHGEELLRWEKGKMDCVRTQGSFLHEGAKTPEKRRTN